ncbi:hypothetical protein C4D60_Mb07t13620 [Musa balbisiana]|uniref:Uncharacterized protein n=1 Tax=Musa balbisiana TaxID=52838 RepID=A0A4S8JF24_MUSBA|nr:hypothetical protein C4D60_Mb07t13620 [Musa balbisiana]
MVWAEWAHWIGRMRSEVDASRALGNNNGERVNLVATVRSLLSNWLTKNRVTNKAPLLARGTPVNPARTCTSEAKKGAVCYWERIECEYDKTASVDACKRLVSFGRVFEQAANVSDILC